MIAAVPIIPTMIPPLIHTSYYYAAIQQQYSSPLFKTGMELSELCSTIVQALLPGGEWEIDRQMNFTLFCNRLLLQLDIPPSVVYMSLKYFQNILLKSINKQNNLIDIAAATTHEYSLFTVSLLLAYKFLEDNPPFMNQWSYASMISIQELKKLELQALDKLEFSLNISINEFYQWTEQCNNAIYYDMPLKQHHYDLQQKQTIPVFTMYNDIVPRPTMSSTSCCSSASSSSLPDDDYCWLPAVSDEDYYNSAAAAAAAVIGGDNSTIVVDDFLFIDSSNDYNTMDYYYPIQQQQQDYTTSCSNNTLWLLQQQQQQPIPIDHFWYLAQPSTNTIFL